MRGETALATSRAGLFPTPLMRATFLVRDLPPLAGNLALLFPVHGCESPVFFAHVSPFEQCQADRRGLVALAN